MIKVGDKYLCIKDRLDHNRNFINKSGKEYKIFNIRQYYLEERVEVFFTNETNMTSIFYHLIDDGIHYHVDEYFNTNIKKLRREKLNKIYGSNL